VGVAYATSEAALFVLCLALAGLFSAACQAILLKSLEKEVPNLTNQVGAFADLVVNSLNNASEQWAVGTNGVINSLNTDINDQMFGWVNTTTTAINETLNIFVDETVKVLNTTFGGTVLYQPIMDVLDCLVLMKVTGIQKALTWVSDNAHFDFPSLPNDTFSLGAVASIASGSSTPSDSFLSAPGDQASDEISAAVIRVVASVEDTIRTEALIATVILLVWVLIVLIGIIRALTLWFGRDKTRGEGGASDFRSGPEPGPDDFQDVPLETIHVGNRPATPAPKYSTTTIRDTKDPFASADDDYQDQKLGFAGQRDYKTSLSKQTTANGRSRVVSSRAEVWNDYKTGT